MRWSRWRADRASLTACVTGLYVWRYLDDETAEAAKREAGVATKL